MIVLVMNTNIKIETLKIVCLNKTLPEEEWLIEPSIFCPFRESRNFLFGGLRFSLDFAIEPVTAEESFSREVFGRTVILPVM